MLEAWIRIGLFLGDLLNTGRNVIAWLRHWLVAKRLCWLYGHGKSERDEWRLPGHSQGHGFWRHCVRCKTVWRKGDLTDEQIERGKREGWAQ